MYAPPSTSPAPLAAARERAAVPWGWLDLLALVVVGYVLYRAAIEVVRLLVRTPARAVLAALGRFLVGQGIAPHVINLVVSSLLLYGIVAGTIVLWLRVVRRYPISWAMLGYRPAPLARFGAVAFLIYPATFLASLVTTGLTVVVVRQVLHRRFDNPQTQEIFHGVRATTPNIVILLLLVAALAPLVEETVFRGVLYQWLRGKLPVSVAAVISAAIFAAAHQIPVIFPGLFVTGVALALTFEYCHSIYGSALLHGLVNGINILAVMHTLAT